LDAQRVIDIRKAADLGHAEAQLLLGTMYEKGRGIERDTIQAYFWYKVAELLKAAHISDIASEGRIFLEQNMSSSQIIEAEILVRDWFEKHQQQ
jgi:TPR repeat protein